MSRMVRFSSRAERTLIGFEFIAEGNCHILVRHGYEAYAPLFAPAGSAMVGRVAQSIALGGREAHPVFSLSEQGRVIVRAYRRGGVLGRINRKLYFRGHRAFDELFATIQAGAGGVQVPEVVLAAERRLGLGYIATIATRWIEGAVDGAAWLRTAAPAVRAEALQEVGRQIGLMHEAGVAHPDLNLRNLLVVESPDRTKPMVYLIDFDRARLSKGPTPRARRARDIQRLGRSARKLELPLERDNGWLALRLGYGGAWPLNDLGYRAKASFTLAKT